MKTLSERIEIKKTPKLGSTKETRKFVKEAVKEWATYEKRLVGESARLFFSDMKKQMKVGKLVAKCKKENESLLSSPNITVDGEMYWVIRYGPHPLKVRPPSNFPTGYTVFDTNNNVIQDLGKCKMVCKLYRIWEEFYFRPYKIPRGKTMARWIANLKERIFDDISKRRQTNYSGMEGSEEERRALEELDEEVFMFHNADMELLALEEKLCDLQFDLYEHPSKTNIHDFMQLSYRLMELMSLQKQYLDRRLNAWEKYQHLLERKYKVHINMEFDMTGLGSAAFIDLMKYLLFQRTIPEAVLTKFTLGILKDVGKAKGLETILNFFVHYGGLKSLETQTRDSLTLLKTLNGYLKIWETEIPSEKIRLP